MGGEERGRGSSESSSITSTLSSSFGAGAGDGEAVITGRPQRDPRDVQENSYQWSIQGPGESLELPSQAMVTSPQPLEIRGCNISFEVPGRRGCSMGYPSFIQSQTPCFQVALLPPAVG